MHPTEFKFTTVTIDALTVQPVQPGQRIEYRNADQRELRLRVSHGKKRTTSTVAVDGCMCRPTRSNLIVKAQ